MPGFKNTALALLCFYCTMLTNAQTYHWTRQIEGHIGGSSIQPFDIETDDSGFVYIAGKGGGLDLDPGPDTLASSTLPNSSYLGKYTASGHLVWGFGITPDMAPYSTWVDLYDLALNPSTGDIVITGVFQGNVDFDPGPSSIHQSTLIPSASAMFLACYDKNGHHKWSRMIGFEPYTASGATPRKVQIDHGRIFVAGGFWGNTDFDPTPTGAGVLHNTDGYDGFVAQYDMSGNFVSAFASGGVVDMSISTGNEIILLGSITESMDFDLGVGTHILTPSAPGRSYIAKYGITGNLIWAKLFDNTSAIDAYNLSTSNDGDIFISGRFLDDADLDLGPGTAILTDGYAFFARYDHDFNFTEAYPLTVTGFVFGIASTAVDTNKNFYMAGHFDGQIDFDPGPGTHLKNAMGGIDLFFAKYAANGEMVWAHALGSPGDDITSAIATGNNNDIYITGYFSQTCDFDPGTGIDNFSTYDSVNPMTTDIYFSKYTDIEKPGPAAINDAGNEDVLIVYPNPSNGHFVIELPETTETQVTITNMKGQIVFSHKYNLSSITVQLDAAAGIYLLQVSTSKTTTTKKLVLR